MKLCKICHIRPATLPDRDYQGLGRVRKEVCELCHAERLRADLRSILAKKKKEDGGNAGPPATLTRAQHFKDMGEVSMNDDWLSELEEYVQNYVTEDASLTESFNHFRQVFSYDRLVAEVKWLQEQVDQFQQDKKRLDWLEEFDHFNRTAIDKEMEGE